MDSHFLSSKWSAGVKETCSQKADVPFLFDASSWLRVFPSNGGWGLIYPCSWGKRCPWFRLNNVLHVTGFRRLWAFVFLNFQYHDSFSLRHWLRQTDWLPTLEATLALDEESVRRVGDDTVGGPAVSRQLRVTRIVMRDLLIGVCFISSLTLCVCV